MTLLYVLLAIGAGSLVPIQSGVNATLRGFLGHYLLAAITNFTLGLTLLTLLIIALRLQLPNLTQMAGVPWWCWTGGAMGAILVVAGVTLAHKLGAATFIACIILGQLSTSVLLDHFALVGFAQHPVSAPRIAGLLLLAAGVLLIHRS
jgi:transporter family-2 protein